MLSNAIHFWWLARSAFDRYSRLERTAPLSDEPEESCVALPSLAGTEKVALPSGDFLAGRIRLDLDGKSRIGRGVGLPSRNAANG